MILYITKIRMKFKKYPIVSSKLRGTKKILVVEGTCKSCFRERVLELKGERNED